MLLVSGIVLLAFSVTGWLAALLKLVALVLGHRLRSGADPDRGRLGDAPGRLSSGRGGPGLRARAGDDRELSRDSALAKAAGPLYPPHPELPA